MKKINIVFLLLFTVLLGCNNYNPNTDNIIFRYQIQTVVDFKEKHISIEMINYKGVLKLSKDEEEKIFSSFNKNKIGKLKGEIFVSDSLVLTPIIDSEFKVYKRQDLILNAIINEGYETEQTSNSEKNRVADFRDTVKKVLLKNESFRLALDSLNRHIKQHNLFLL